MSDVQTMFNLSVEGMEYKVTMIDEKDQVFYKIQCGREKPSFIGLNENAEWEATDIIKPGLVRKLGALIENKFM